MTTMRIIAMSGMIRITGTMIGMITESIRETATCRADMKKPAANQFILVAADFFGGND